MGSTTRGPVLDIVRALLAEGRTDDVLAVVARLVAKNSELEQRLQQLLSRGHKNEGVSTTQLKLFIDALGVENKEAGELDVALVEANKKLREASGIDDASAAAARAADASARREPDRRAGGRATVPALRPRARVHRSRRHRGGRAGAGAARRAPRRA
jgi:hypothetical protein